MDNWKTKGLLPTPARFSPHGHCKPPKQVRPSLAVGHLELALSTPESPCPRGTQTPLSATTSQHVSELHTQVTFY